MEIEGKGVSYFVTQAHKLIAKEHDRGVRGGQKSPNVHDVIYECPLIIQTMG